MSNRVDPRLEIMRLIEGGEIAAAERMLRSLGDLESIPVDLLIACGNAYLKLGLLDSAHDVFKFSLGKELQSPEIYYGIAVCEKAKKNHHSAIDAFREVLRSQPRHLAAALYLGVCYEQVGQKKAALSTFLKAVRLADSLNKSAIPDGLKRILAHASEVIISNLADIFRERLSGIVSEYGVEKLDRVIAGTNIFLGVQAPNYAHELWRPALMYVPGLKPRMFYERDEFAFLGDLEKITDVIRDEFLHVWSQDHGFAPYISHPETSFSAETWRDLNNSRNWSTYHFYRQGRVFQDNCRRCPETSNALSKLPLHSVPGYSPEAMFSALKPRTKIKAHYGPVNGRLIVHLPLVVPENCGAITVGDETRTWRQGECLIFDDSMRHEAWNDSDELRAVLIFDIWNPQMQPHERLAMTEILAAAQSFETELLAIPF